MSAVIVSVGIQYHSLVAKSKLKSNQVLYVPYMSSNIFFSLGTPLFRMKIYLGYFSSSKILHIYYQKVIYRGLTGPTYT